MNKKLEGKFEFQLVFELYTTGIENEKVRKKQTKKKERKNNVYIDWKRNWLINRASETEKL